VLIISYASILQINPTNILIVLLCTFVTLVKLILTIYGVVSFDILPTLASINLTNDDYLAMKQDPSQECKCGVQM
jgi:hypothetical protein